MITWPWNRAKKYQRAAIAQIIYALELTSGEAVVLGKPLLTGPNTVSPIKRISYTMSLDESDIAWFAISDSVGRTMCAIPAHAVAKVFYRYMP